MNGYYPPPTGTASSTGTNNSPRRDSGTTCGPQHAPIPAPAPPPAPPPWPLNLPGFLDYDDDVFADMFFTNPSPIEQADVAFETTETSDDVLDYVRDKDDDDSDSELSETTSSSDVSEYSDDEMSVDEDVEADDEEPVQRVRASPPRPARHPSRPDLDEYDTGAALDGNDWPLLTDRHDRTYNPGDDRYDFDMHFSVAPPPARALQASEVPPAGPRNAAGRAHLRVYGIVDQRRSRRMEARQRMAARQNARALAALRGSYANGDATDDEGSVLLSAATVRARYPSGSQ